jgi:hypothetical protein
MTEQGLSGSRGKLGLSPTAPGLFVMPPGPDPGTIDCSRPISPSSKVSGRHAEVVGESARER